MINREHNFLAQQNARWQRRNLSRAIAVAVMTLALLALARNGFGQSSLPDKGSLADIAGKKTAYIDVVDPTNAFKQAFTKAGLIEAAKADTADFVIEYRQIGETEYITDFRIPLEKGSLTVYYFRDTKKVIVWQDTASDSGKHPSPDDKLLKRFLKDKAKAEK